MRSQRQLRVGEIIRHALANVFVRGDVPWPQGFVAGTITVTAVDISPDLQNATAFIMPLGGAKTDETVQALNSIAGFFRHGLAETVKLRYVPKLVFKADTSFEYASRIEHLLQIPEVAKDLKATKED